MVICIYALHCVNIILCQEHGGNLNEAVNAHFSEGDRNLMTGYSLFSISKQVIIEKHNPFYWYYCLMFAF